MTLGHEVADCSDHPFLVRYECRTCGASIEVEAPTAIALGAVAEWLQLVHPKDARRQPYVGSGRDGCLRSAQIDREDAWQRDVNDPRVPQLFASAEAWERQAETEPD